MSINVVSHNLTGINAERMLGIHSVSKAKSMEKLSSGYKVNRAGDDAAGLHISETMRRMIRGLNQGTENAQDGISWVQTGDGALEEVHAMLHRMTELSVKSLNGTWSDADRALMQSEFEQLQKEIDRLTDAAVFNEQHIFADHEFPYYQFEGNKHWDYDQMHYVVDGQNELIISYKETPYGETKTASIKVDEGLYTTKELLDEIDTALEDAGLRDKGFSLEYTIGGTCNLNYDGGASIEEVTGGLAYLLYDTYEGGSTGSLIGTTQYLSENARLPIRKDVNDHMEFDIESLDGTTQHIDLTIAEGSYTRRELIDMLNEKLKDTSVKAVEYGLSIKLESDDSIITALKGNMFKVDDASKGEAVFTSVFYDNIRYGEAETHPGILTGGAVLSTNATDEEHNHFEITSSNNVLLVSPNGSKDVTRLEIKEGYYTAEEMSAELNRLFIDNGLELTATAYSTGYGANAYKGLIITSNVKGAESDVGIDSGSSAYNTLFVTREYNTVQENEKKTRDSRTDTFAYYIGGKIFTNDDWPFDIEKGKNDKFRIEMDGKSFEIALEENTYDSASALLDAINGAIKEAASKLADADDKALLESVSATYVSASSGYRFRLNTTSETISLSASSVAGNTGYEDIFTTTVTHQQQNTGQGEGSVTTNTAIDDVSEVPTSKRRFTVYVNGRAETIYITAKQYNSRQELLDEINAQFKEAWTEEAPNTFSNVSAYGSGGTMSKSGVGSENAYSVNYSDVGDSDIGQGSAGSSFKRNEGASITISLRSGAPFTINDSNNVLEIEINSVKKKITLQNGTYSNASALKDMLQKSLNDAFGTGFGGVDVTASSNSLTLKARLFDNGVEQDGKGTSIKCSTASSSFLKDMNTSRSAASVNLNSYALKSSITINSSNNTFEFTYKENGGAEKKVQLKLAAKTYNTRQELVAELNRLLDAQKIGVTASLNGSYLMLSTDSKGNGCEISYDSTSSGNTSADAIFAGLEKTAASVTLDRDMESSIKIDNTSNQFSVYVNGQKKTVTLKNGTYNRDTFIKELNSKLGAVGLAATKSGNRIVLTTKDKGPNVSVRMVYSDGGSSMKNIFGVTKIEHPKLEASFNADNKLVITAKDKNGKVTKDKLQVMSDYGSIFQRSKETGKKTTNGTAYAGYHSAVHTTIDGAAINKDKVKIDRWNKQLSFRYYKNKFTSPNNYSYINVTLTEKEYTYDELQKELQSKLDAAAGAGEFKVEVSEDGVKIIAGKEGGRYDMDGFSGGFYYNVLRRNKENSTAMKVSEEKGYYDADVYAIGRKDIRHGTTEITSGVNDTLSLDFTIGNHAPIKLEFTLDAGKYSGDSLIRHIQQKLNEELKRNGFEENLIEAQIGGYNTGVVGSNDDNALVFKMSKHSRLPEPDVEYKIDGVGGKAAFSVFYQTDGDIKTAYINGTKDISKGVTLDKDSDLSFDVDGKTYTVTVSKGTYSSKEIIDKLNELLKDAAAPVVAKNVDGVLQLSYTKYGKHKITNVTGDAKQQLFFQENGSPEGEKDIWIRVGSESGDGITIKREVMNTVSLGLNSLVISKKKYAEKALRRVKEAVTKVSEVRSEFGAEQNRLERTVNKNKNTSENMQASESSIRDTDVAGEIMRLSKENILENVAGAMLAQANHSREYIMSLFQ